MIIDTIDIESRVRRNPYGMVAGALGLGFILGGGLFTRLTGRIVASGLRIGLAAALPIFKDQLVLFAQRGLGGSNGDINNGNINKGES